MKPDLKNVDDFVNRYLPSAPTEEMESDAARVLQRLRSMADQAGECGDDERVAELESVSAPRWPRMAVLGIAAAVLLAVIATTGVWRQSTGIERADTPDGASSLAIGKSIRTNDTTGTMVSLPDGSRVEMQSQSELSLEHADDG